MSRTIDEPGKENPFFTNNKDNIFDKMTPKQKEIFLSKMNETASEIKNNSNKKTKINWFERLCLIINYIFNLVTPILIIINFEGTSYFYVVIIIAIISWIGYYSLISKIKKDQ